MLEFCCVANGMKAGNHFENQPGRCGKSCRAGLSGFDRSRARDLPHADRRNSGIHRQIKRTGYGGGCTYGAGPGRRSVRGRNAAGGRRHTLRCGCGDSETGTRSGGSLFSGTEGHRTMSAAWTIDSVREALAAKKISARELAADFYKRIGQRNEELNAFLTLSEERAYAQADRMDALVAAGKPLPAMAGVPIAIKDVISTRGVRTTCGSKILENYIPPYDATAVERLEAAGAVILGKTNCDEFAMGSSNENSAYGAVRNPEATDRVPGGSSGGSAAAVAAGIAVAALGTDTGGSIRQPGSFCGVPAMMGSYGRVSRYGLIAFASSLDRIGPLATSVKDVAAVLSVMAGAGPADFTFTAR